MRNGMIYYDSGHDPPSLYSTYHHGMAIRNAAPPRRLASPPAAKATQLDTGPRSVC